MSGLLVNLCWYGAAAFGAWAIHAARGAQDRVFWPLVLTLVGAVGLGGIVLSEPPEWFPDFVDAYWKAGRAVLSEPEALAPVLAEGVFGYVNLPIVAYLFAPLGALPRLPAMAIFFVLGALALLAAWFIARRLYVLDRRDSALALFGLAAFGPALYSIKEGNTSHALLAALLGGFLAIRSARPILGGALFGLAALFKPPLLVLGALYFLRGRWRVVAGGAAMLAGAGALSLLVFGWGMHVFWFENVVAPYAGAPIAAFNAQSFAAFFARTETGLAGYGSWDIQAMSQAAKIMAYGLAALLLGLGVFAALRSRDIVDDKAIELEALMAITLVCVASTLSWSHYYVWLAPALLVLWLRRAELGAFRWAALAALTLALPLEFLSREMRAGMYGPLSNVLTSHLTIAGVLTFACLARLRYGMRAGSSASTRAGEYSATK